MKKRLFLLAFLLASSPAWGANRVKTWIDGETLTASDLNAEFNNIYADVTITISGTWTFTKAGTPITITPASAPGANTPMLEINRSGSAEDVFSVDYEGDVVVRNAIIVSNDAGGSITGFVQIDGNSGDEAELLLQSFGDVAHGLLTGVSELTLTTPDLYFAVGKASDTVGGALLLGMAEATAANPAILLAGYGGAGSTTFATTSRAMVEVRGIQHDGANGLANATADSVIFGVRARRGGSVETVAAVDEDGDLWLDGALLGDGHWFINDTTDANVTTGLTMNQGAADDGILTFKSSDVAHGFTGVYETDTYLLWQKFSATLGGVSMIAAAEAAATTSIELSGVSGTANTTKATTTRAYVEVAAYEGSGTDITNSTDDAALFAVRTRKGGANSTEWVVDEDGNSWQEGSVRVSGTAATITSGTGAPAGGCTTGAIYLRTDGGTDTTLYVCESTAWVAM